MKAYTASSPKRVMIVEDDMVLSMVAKRFVQNMGHEIVATVNNGETAISAFNSKKPDIILMDVRLKGEWSGIDTMRKIRERSSVPVIYLSGSTERENMESARETGYVSFLKKPVTKADLEEAFHQAFGSHGAVSALNETS
jgi:CheY-like chemotaxis protein